MQLDGEPPGIGTQERLTIQKYKSQIITKDHLAIRWSSLYVLNATVAGFRPWSVYSFTS